MEIKINSTELASNLAEERMKTFIQYQREHAGIEPLSEEELDNEMCEEDDNGEMVYKEKYQEMYDDFYDMFEKEILKYQIND